ncbi:MAG: hypothetical protein ABH874_01885 [Methanobacteriota archaeon]
MYSLEVRESVDRIFLKLSKKSPKQMLIINKKTLRAPMQNLRRVHVDRSFVLVYSVDEKNKVVIIEDYEHHTVR